jgi:hypothetical protein
MYMQTNIRIASFIYYGQNRLRQYSSAFGEAVRECVAQSEQRLATSSTTEDWGSSPGTGISFPPRNSYRYWIPPDSRPMGTGWYPPWVKLPGLETDQSLLACAEIKKMRIYTSAPPYAFMA